MGRALAVTPEPEAHAGLRVAITRMAGFGHDAAHIRTVALQYAELACDPPLGRETVEAILADQLLRLTPTQSVPAAPVVPDDELPPPEATNDRSAIEADPWAEFEQKHAPAIPKQNILDLEALDSRDPPEFVWWIQHWLSPHPTLLSGRGGVGKSLLALELAAALASGHAFIGPARTPLRVLYWGCEDPADEIERRLKRIARAFGVRVGAMSDTLHVDARLGLENTLLAPAYGVACWTAAIETLRQQVNDYRIDVLILDNIAHLYACNENNRADVTKFTSGLCGLVTDRPFCPLLLGHVAKGAGSEYAGSTAWENAVRSRWFMGTRLPGETEPEDDEQQESAVRFLCRRKANYSAEDYVRFTLVEGVLKPEPIHLDTGGVYGHAKRNQALSVVQNAIATLAERGVFTSEQPGRNYLPTVAMQYKLNDGLVKTELAAAMRQALVDGQIKRAVVGKTSNRVNKEGLIVC